MNNMNTPRWNHPVDPDRVAAARLLFDSDEYMSAVGILRDAILGSYDCLPTNDSTPIVLDVARMIADGLFKASRIRECADWLDEAVVKQYVPMGDHYMKFIRGWIHHDLRHYQEAEEIANSLLRDVNPISSMELYALSLRLSGMASCNLGKLEKAKTCLRDAEAIFRILDDRDQLIITLCSLGIVEKRSGSLQAAIAYYNKSLSVADAGLSARRRVQIHMGAAVVQYKMGHYADASISAAKAKAYLRGMNDGRQSLIVSLLESRLMMYLGKSDDAIRQSQAAINVAVESNRTREEALALETLGDIATAKAQYDSARRYYERAKAIGESIAPEGDLVAENMRRLASLRLHMGEAFEAVPLLKEAIAFSRRCEERYEIGVAQRHLARAYSQLGQFLGAEQAVRESIGTFTAMGAKLELAKSHVEAARVCHAWYRTLADDIDVATSYRNPHPYNHLESAWTHAIEAFHGFADLERPEEQRACEELMETLRSGGHPLWMRHAVSARETEIRINDKPFIANAPAMKQLITMVEIAASTVEPVLVTGETGTGKELIARFVHERSERANRPFVPVNCAAIPETLFEREFFGHVRGAYTGAEAEKPGLCETAAGGTLFLDEIGDMPVYLQVKLLRLLQEGTFHRLGDPVERHVDLRIVAATNAPLPRLIAEGRFRQDLYYRLQTLEMVIPPLRERSEDLEELVGLFVGKVLGETVDARRLFDSSVWHILRNYPWPGNVRELEAMTRRLALLARHGGKATIDMLPEEMRRWRDRKPHAAGALDLSVYVSRAERERISQALLVKAGNRTEAARALGISRNQLYKKMDKLGIKIPV